MQNDTTEVLMPLMGEGITEATLVKWLKQPGEQVRQEEPLLEVSTDKVDTEIPAPASGVLTEVFLRDGDTVAVNKVIAVIRSSGAAAGRLVGWLLLHVPGCILAKPLLPRVILHLLHQPSKQAGSHPPGGSSSSSSSSSSSKNRRGSKYRRGDNAGHTVIAGGDAAAQAAPGFSINAAQAGSSEQNCPSSSKGLAWMHSCVSGLRHSSTMSTRSST